VKTSILLVCTGNSCRSQMAEAFARRYGGDMLEVYSAGLEPSRINPRAIAVMAEKGISLDGQWSKGLDAVPTDGMDLVVTLCGDAEARCPLIHGRLGRRHWPLPDPAKATGSDEQIMAAFRSVRDDIEVRVRELLAELRPR
jgi:arsenate reductase (thioredoxin)